MQSIAEELEQDVWMFLAIFYNQREPKDKNIEE